MCDMQRIIYSVIKYSSKQWRKHLHCYYAERVSLIFTEMSEVVSFIVFHIHSFQVTFHEAIERPNRNQDYVFTRVRCFPLFSLLLAINATAFNYLSLDAEGAEIQVPIFIHCHSCVDYLWLLNILYLPDPLLAYIDMIYSQYLLHMMCNCDTSMNSQLQCGIWVVGSGISCTHDAVVNTFLK